MDHTEVRGLLEEAMERPGGLVAFQADPSATARAARAHLASCAECAAEWQAWSLTTLGLASAAPDVDGPGPEVRAAIMAAIAARPRVASQGVPVAGGADTAVPIHRASGHVPVPASQVDPEALAVASTGDPATGTRSRGRREGWVRGNQVRTPAPRPPVATGGSSTRDRTRWALVSVAAAVVLLVAGLVVGRQLAGSPDAPRSDPGRVLAVAAEILQGNGFDLVRLVTPTDEPGGVVLVSPGSGRIAVVSDVLEPLPADAGYWCFVERDGIEYRVGPMHLDSGLAFWAGAPQEGAPADLGRQGDTFLVRSDAAGAEPVLTGTF